MNKPMFALFGAAVLAGAAVAFGGGAKSGLAVGESVTPFHPTHVSGPDKGTDTCPPCKYGARPAVQAWFSHETEANIDAIAKEVSSQVKSSSKDLKGFMIMVSNCNACIDSAKTCGTKAEKAGFNNIGFAYIDSKNEAVKNYKFNTSGEVKNTIIVYKDKKVAAKFVNFKPDAAGLKELRAAIASVQK